MTDTELAALAAAFRGIIEEQGTVFRAQLATLQGRLDDEIVKNAAHRLHESGSRERMAKMLADAVGDAVVPHLRQLQQRTVALEQRSKSTEATS
jgi:Arc/MetJ family transcription regulator